MTAEIAHERPPARPRTSLARAGRRAWRFFYDRGVDVPTCDLVGELADEVEALRAHIRERPVDWRAREALRQALDQYAAVLNNLRGPTT